MPAVAGRKASVGDELEEDCGEEREDKTPSRGAHAPALARIEEPRTRLRFQVSSPAEAGLRAIIAAGGSGGHVFCALSIAESLRRLSPDCEVLLAGAPDGAVLEETAAQIAVRRIWISGLSRERSLAGLARNARSFAQVPVSLVQAARLLRELHPHVVIGTGGHASGPVTLVAQWLGIPTLIQEQNAQPGITSRLLALGADVACLGMKSRLRARGRTLVTGNPVRARAIRPVAAEEARRSLGLAPAAITLLVIGGSYGSTTLNDWLLRSRGALSEAQVQIIWQCGRRHLATCAAAADRSLHVVPFIEDIASAYSAADLVVTSAGAVTLAELACWGKPSVVAPDRGVAGDHQVANALALEREQAILHAARTGDILPAVLSLLGDRARRTALANRIQRLARPLASDEVAREALLLASRSRRWRHVDNGGPPHIA